MTELARAAAAAQTPDGAPRGQDAVDRLVALLDLERIEENIFRGVSPPESPVRVFGGQVAGQALVAAGRTVPAERAVHSLHAYFIRPGDPRVPIVYEVDRIRDGRSFTTRRAVAIQHGQAIFALSASFQCAEEGLTHAEPMPDVPAPERLPDLASWISRAGTTQTAIARLPLPFDLRYVTPPVWARDGRRATEPGQAGPGQTEPGQTGQGPTGRRDRLWMRADGRLPDHPLVHVCVLAYASDLTLLESVTVRHGRALEDVRAASLDHAMWFHRPFRADEWVLYDCTSPSASGGRGLALGQFFSRDGRLIATVVQEGLVRVRT